MSTVTITFAGRAVQAKVGQTVAAALVEAGIRSWRTTRHHHRPRGLFCGIGICFDCLITVDGLPAQRACLVGVRDGMTVDPDDDGTNGGTNGDTNGAGGHDREGDDG
jgi:predicted molibdopterin-dependent oxidoreductase YjgC